ncbi:MAG TPA: hypothetical protein GXX75_19785 [Clostridiales bacterium]|nr:hypothetical protein [Clostridiales bacterium]
MSQIKKVLEKVSKDYGSFAFWSWNDELKEEELRRQIKHMKECGLGGFFMHARGGLKTEYMGEDWFGAVSASLEEAGESGMNAWIYDEHGWPSGFAGMKLLEDPKYHVHYITYDKKDDYDPRALAVYQVDENNIKRIYEYSADIKEYHCIYDQTNASTVDILNPDIVDQFIKETHEKYYARYQDQFGNFMVGFFTDEPQYFRWDTAYSPVMLSEFKSEYGEDLLEHLGALFIDCNQSYELRFRYWRLMNKLFVNSFAKRIYDWCEAHNCKLTGHAVEESSLFAQMWCCAGVMPFYEYEHIPGIDWLGRDLGTDVTPRQVSSVAQQMGKKQVLTETFALTGWDVTPKELKRIAEWQFVNGVNLMTYHLYPYSIRGQRKRDYPAFFSDCNPWIAEFRQFNEYFAGLGYLLAESKEAANVAVIHPMHSAYLTYNRETDYESVQKLEDSFQLLVDTLGSAQVVHHYVDELMLERHGRVVDGRLSVGNCSYEYIVIPEMPGIDSSTLRLLKEFTGTGGKIYLEGRAPLYVDGKRTEIDFLKSNVFFEELVNQYYKIDNKATRIRSTYRQSEFGDFIYAVNLSDDTEYAVNLHINAQGASLFDLEKREEKAVYFEEDMGGIRVPLVFQAGQSYIILIQDEAAPGSKDVKTGQETHCDTRMSILASTENALTLDYADLSYDNERFEEKLPIMAISDRLLKERRNGKVYLRYTFQIGEIPNTMFLETEKMNAVNVWINDTNIRLEDQGRLDRSFVRGNIIDYIKTGKNTIVYEIDYYQDETVYYVLFDCKDGTESLTNCLSYDTDIEAVYILGDFQVVSEDGFAPGGKNTRIAAGNFSITKSKNEIDASRIVEEGYPFFAGEMILEKEILLEEKDCFLQLVGRFAVAEVFLNDQFVAKLMFDDRCELSGYAKAGTNRLRIRLINGNRNLLGPFHCADDPEPYAVYPGLFDMYNTWNDGKSDLYRDSYSFVYFGVSDLLITTKN